ncbi:Glycosyltransferase 2-like domain-containing protein [Bordetella tumbae]|uniref:glycosyltransferase n=1 Tax=Bordetella tumbae TaxID=1649139 RepID=UPI0039EF84CE
MDKVISTIKDSGLLDQKWYLSEYPDVAALGMDPVVHYVQLGALLYRDPAPNFSTRAYLVENPDVLRAGINPLYHYVIWGEREGRESRDASKRFSTLDEKSLASMFDPSILDTLAKSDHNNNLIKLPDWHLPRASLISKDQVLTPFSVMDLEVKLWGGYSSYAIVALEKMKYAASSTVIEKINIGWHLARWYFVEGQFEEALKNVLFSKYYCLRAFRKLTVPLMKLAVVESQCLSKMGKMKRARKALENITSRMPGSSNLNLAWAAVAGEKDVLDEKSIRDRDAPLPWINRLFEERGLAQLKKIDENAPLSFFNFTAEDVKPLPLAETPEKISIIIPAYGAEETIHIPILSLLKQTWSNLEVIVVDDCSPDGMADVVKKIAQQDSRVKLIRMEVNGGAYPARNLGLKYATGDFIMVHDSDDWSHPQKLEIQMNGFKAADNPIAVVSHWVRFNQHLRPLGAWRPTGSFFDLNFSSLMFRRGILDEIGGWDEVRVSGDAEFRARIARRYGKNSVVKISQSYLLSLSLMRDDSLTQTKITHLRSLDFGLRWLYRDAYQYWHGSDYFQRNPSIKSDSSRPFPVPKILRSRSNQEGSFDFLIVTDLSAEAWTTDLLLYIKAAKKKGWSTALCHWPRYEGYVHTPIDARVYEACQQYDVEIITNGDVISVQTALVPHPEIFQYKLDQFPQVRAERIAVIANEPATVALGDYEIGRKSATSKAIKSHIAEFLGNSGTWWAASLSLQSELKSADPNLDVSTSIWWPIFELHQEKLQSKLPNKARKVPKLGRYYGDSILIGETWPKSFRDAKRAYCADESLKIYFIGGEDMICSHFGRHPKNWVFKGAEEISVEKFSKDIDFYLYYPDRTYTGVCDPVMLRAMAAGLPVITYPEFRKLFRNAAIYAAPERVVSIATEYWNDSKRYSDASKKARIFAVEQCSVNSFSSRFGA